MVVNELFGKGREGKGREGKISVQNSFKTTISIRRK
jgi:hypothetical protein